MMVFTIFTFAFWVSQGELGDSKSVMSQIEARSASIEQKINSIKSNGKTNIIGVEFKKGFLEVRGSENPDLIKFEDMMPHFLAIYHNVKVPIAKDLHARGFDREGQEALDALMATQPITELDEQVQTEFLARVEDQKKTGNFSRKDAARLIREQKINRNSVFLKWSDYFFDNFSIKNQRILYSYIVERFSKLTKNYWLRIPQGDVDYVLNSVRQNQDNRLIK